MILDHLTSRALGSDRSSSLDGLSRRRFVQAGAAAGGGLMLSLNLPFAHGAAHAAEADGFAPNAFIRIGGDGRIVLTMPYVEMGQGTYTSIPMLIAEELEVDLKQVQLEHAPPNEKLYGNPLLGGIRSRKYRAIIGRRCEAYAPLTSGYNGLVGGSNPLGPTTHSVGCGDKFRLRCILNDPKAAV
jgi:isoquinoline 1-oxidoreductase subunit beta